MRILCGCAEELLCVQERAPKEEVKKSKGAGGEGGAAGEGGIAAHETAASVRYVLLLTLRFVPLFAVEY